MSFVFSNDQSRIDLEELKHCDTAGLQLDKGYKQKFKGITGGSIYL